MTNVMQTNSGKFSILGALSVVVGAATVLGMILAMVIGWRMNRMAVPAVILWCATPAAALGMTLAVLSLVQRNRRRQAAHYGLWINGLIAVFGAPIAMVWSLAF